MRGICLRPGSGSGCFVGLLAAFAAGKAVRFDTLDPDCFWHLRVADQLAAGPIGPVVDHLSFSSRSDAWTPYSWGAELAMRAVWRAGGYRAAVGVQAVLQATFVLVLGAGVRRGDQAPPALHPRAATGRRVRHAGGGGDGRGRVPVAAVPELPGRSRWRWR